VSGEKIRIAHIVEGFLGGTSTYMKTVLPSLVCRGFDVTLICSLYRCRPDADAVLRELFESGVRIEVIDMRRQINPVRDLAVLIRIWRLLKKSRIDIVHTHCSKAGAVGRMAAKLGGIKAIVHSPHCFAFVRCGGYFRRRMYLAFERLFGKLTDMLIGVSASEAKLAVRSKVVSRNKSICIPNGLQVTRCGVYQSASKIKQRLGIDAGVLVVSTACRLVEYKGIIRLLEAVMMVRSGPVVFLIAGEGKERMAAERFITDNKLTEKVRLLGHVDDMERIYTVSDVVVLCSDAEAHPYLLLEAMRAQRPIVATRVIGNCDLITDRRTGLLCGQDSKEIAMAIDELLLREDKRREYASNAYGMFCRHLSLEQQITKLTATYKDCLVRKDQV
jgi:glycosyltransferase involved in cell wall biosynthesis